MLPALQPREARLPVPPEKAAFVAAGALCHICPLRKHRLVRSERARVPVPTLALVGEAPGRREVQIGKPFVGKSGELLNHVLQQAGVERRELAVINAVACGPIPSENDIIKNAAVRCCRPRLITELRATKPKGVLAIGGKALASLAPPKASGITALRGALIPLADDVVTPTWSPPFFATFHPSHIMRGGDGDNDGPEGEDTSSVDLLYYFLLFDLAKAHQYVTGKAKGWQDDLDLFVMANGHLHRATTDDEGLPIVGAHAKRSELRDALERAIEEGARHGELTCDVETDAKDSIDAKLTAIAYGSPDGAVSATWEAWRAFDSIFTRLKELHADKAQRWNWQNGIYDRIVFRRYGIPCVGPHEDTLLGHHGAFPGLPHKLDQVATQFFVTVPWKNEFRKSAKNEAELVLYNARDVVCTAKISPALKRFLKQHKTERVYEADRQINVIATRMRWIGLYVDREEQARHRAQQTARLEYMQKALVEDFAAIEEPWRNELAKYLANKQRKNDPDSYEERVGIRYKEIAKREKKPSDIGLFKPKAKNDIVALFSVLKIPFTAYTPKGAPVTDKKAMELAAARHPLMRRLEHIRSAMHLIATYIELPVKADGRMHPDWKTTKITGRWGAGKSQNVPNNVPGWPPEVGDDGKFKVNANGSLIVPRENMRSIIAAPTAEQVLASAKSGWLDPQVVARARAGFGRSLVGADMDQVELRILAFLARDPFLLGIFNEGRDPHSEFAAHIFPNHFPQLIEKIKAAGFKPKQMDDVQDLIDQGRDDLKDVLKAMKQWKRLRDLTKRVEYGGAYRGKPATIWEALVKEMPEVALESVEHGIKVFYEMASQVPVWHNEQETLARIHRESREALLGRVRLFPLGNFSPNVVVNFPIQAYGASLMTLAIFRFTALTHPELLEFDRLYKWRLLDAKWVKQMRARGFGEWNAPVELISNGHDSLLVEADVEDAKRAAELLQEAMTQTRAERGISMTFSAEARVSQRWSRT